MENLILVRHGQSQWNQENRFTGWVDVDLSTVGRQEAKLAGEILKKEGFSFDVAYTSVLKRAIRTMWYVLDELDQMWIPQTHSWRLNERHYGALQGLDKTETVKKYGEEQVKIWRRSYDTPPPALSDSDSRHPKFDSRYKHVLLTDLPACESLKDTEKRFISLWHEKISIDLRAGKQVLIVAHGNSLRALVKYLDQVSPKDILELNIPTGVPLVYQISPELKALSHRYLGDPKEIEEKIKGVANQTKK